MKRQRDLITSTADDRHTPIRSRLFYGSRGMDLARSPSRANHVQAVWGKFAVDSPLEESGFEPTSHLQQRR
jgi:hypothetical protein